MSAALTLRRDMLEVIAHKSLPHCQDDLQWPHLSETCTASQWQKDLEKRKRFISSLSEPADDDSDEDDSTIDQHKAIQNYWAAIRERYWLQNVSLSTLASSETSSLPNNWTIVNISVSLDKDTLVCCRREGGDGRTDVPLIFCIPLRGRRDHGGGEVEEEHLTFDGALRELQNIIHSSDESTKMAINIKPDDEKARSDWWKHRGRLDARLQELLENIEYCWLGAFKVETSFISWLSDIKCFRLQTIFSPRLDVPSETISELGENFEKVFHRNLHMKDKKTRKTTHKKKASQMQMHTPNQFKLGDTFIRCFSTLSPKCRDEELEDLVYFVLDLYQFHGVPIAIAEVDIDQVVVDLRTVLEEYTMKQHKRSKSFKLSTAVDEHIFLVLDKNVQGIPWESLPILRGRSVSRIPGVQFLHDRIAFAKWKREAAGDTRPLNDRAVVEPRKGYFILNPSGDLNRTEDRFRNWANGMKAIGWDGTIGRPISEQQFTDALQSNDLVM